MESIHGECEQSFTPCPSANSKNQKTDLQKMGLKIAFTKIFVLLFWHHHKTSAAKLLLCKDYWTPNENGMWGMCFSGEQVKKFLRIPDTGNRAFTRSCRAGWCWVQVFPTKEQRQEHWACCTHRPAHRGCAKMSWLQEVMESALTPVNRLQGPSEASCHHPPLRGHSFLLVQDFGTCPLPKDQTGLPPYCKDLPIYLDLPGKIIKSNGKWSPAHKSLF